MKIDRRFFKSPNDIFDYNLSEHEIIVYLYLCRCSNEKESAYPSYSTIARKCGISKKTAQRAIEDLIDRKLIIKEKRFSGNEQITNTFELNMPNEALKEPVNEKPKHIRDAKIKHSESNGRDTQTIPMDRVTTPMDTQSLHPASDSHPGRDTQSPKEELYINNNIKRNSNKDNNEEEHIDDKKKLRTNNPHEEFKQEVLKHFEGNIQLTDQQISRLDIIISKFSKEDISRALNLAQLRTGMKYTDKTFEYFLMQFKT